MRSTTALKRTVAPAVLPISVSEMRDHLRITSLDEDAYIESLIQAAVAHVDGEGDLGRAIITQTWAQWVSEAPGDVRLLIGPFQALVSVEYYDATGTQQTATLGDFQMQLAGDFVVCKPKDGKTWPSADTRPDAIKISYTAGYGSTAAAVPAGIRHALKVLVAHWYENRGIASQEAMNDVPMAYHALIGNERVGWYG